MKIVCNAALALAALVLCPCVQAQEFKIDHELSPEDKWFEILHGGSLKPGDVVVLKAGVYSDQRRLELNHRGTKEEPILIIARKGAILKRTDAKQNCLNIAGCQYLTLSGLEITGGSAGIRIAKKGNVMAKFLTFTGLHIHDTAGAAITANNEGNTYTIGAERFRSVPIVRSFRSGSPGESNNKGNTYTIRAWRSRAVAKVRSP